MSSERGDLRVNLTGNSSGFTSMLNASKLQAKKFTEEVSKGWSVGAIGSGLFGGLIGASSFDALKGLIGETFSRAKEIKELSEQFDLSTDSVQRWEKALGKAGLESTTFFRAIENIRSKREEARNDPSKRDLFDRLGLTGSALSTGVSDEDFLAKLLSSGASRPQLIDLLGRNGARLGAATPFLSGSDPLLSESAVDQISQGEKNIGGIGRFFKGLLTKSAGGYAMTFTSEFWSDVGTAMTGGLSELMAKRAAKSAAKASEHEADKLKNSNAAEDEAAYQELVKQNKTETENTEKLRDAEEKLRVAKRKAMGPASRRADMHDELTDLDSRIKYYLDAESLLGPADKLKMAGLMTQRANLAAEMMIRPTALGGDELTAIGGFGASRLADMVLGGSGSGQTIQQQQLDALQSIERNTNPTLKPDPFQ